MWNQIERYGILFYDVENDEYEFVGMVNSDFIVDGGAENRKDVGAFWWNDFQTMFTNSYGDSFETQRELERKSLVHTLEKFQSSENADELSNLMFSLLRMQGHISQEQNCLIWH